MTTYKMQFKDNAGYFYITYSAVSPLDLESKIDSISRDFKATLVKFIEPIIYSKPTTK